jgi:cell division transport system permease protein
MFNITNAYRRALKDIINNRFLNTITIITIALAILIVSAFTLFFTNANRMIHAWEEGVQIMAYLEAGQTTTDVEDVKQRLHSTTGIKLARFVSRDEALQRLKKQLAQLPSLFENLRENPLPDAFEVHIAPGFHNSTHIKVIAEAIQTMPGIAEVEYGQQWFGRFVHIVNLFRIAGYTLGGIFIIAAIFIVANTTRLVLYSRQEEVEIMRLVGATDGFIKTPFYIEGLIQGTVGGLLGLGTLFIAFLFLSTRIQTGLTATFFQSQFLSPGILISIILCSTLVGWLGCYLSLKQFLKISL